MAVSLAQDHYFLDALHFLQPLVQQFARGGERELSWLSANERQTVLWLLRHRAEFVESDESTDGADAPRGQRTRQRDEL